MYVNPNFEVEQNDDFFSLLENSKGQVKSFSVMEKKGSDIEFKEKSLEKDRVLLCKVNATKGLFMLSDGSTDVDFI